MKAAKPIFPRSLSMQSVQAETGAAWPQIVEPGSAWRDAAQRIRAVVLLAGAVRPSLLARAVGRSLLNLPVSGSEQVIDVWRRQFALFGDWLNDRGVELRVIVDQSSPAPKIDPADGPAIAVQRDPRPYRGTGGVLRDMTEDYDDNDLIVMANGFQLLTEPLPSLTADLLAAGADVALIDASERAPVSLMLIARRALRQVSPIGYVDLKEQALPRLTDQCDVAVVRREGGAGLPLRTRSDYITALRRHNGRGVDAGDAMSAFAEDWRTSFSLIEPGANVDPTARVHDSVVLDGATVQPEATLIRSVVCGGAVVARGRAVVDEIVT
jgi:hypothetical protein